MVFQSATLIGVMLASSGVADRPVAMAPVEPPVLSMSVGQSFDFGNGRWAVRYPVTAVTQAGDGVRLRVKSDLTSWRDTYHIHLSPAVVAEFRRLGVSDLAAHFNGRVVQVRGQQETKLNPGIRGIDIVLTVSRLSEFDAVEPVAK